MISFSSALALFTLSLSPLAGQAVTDEQTHLLANEDPYFPIGKAYLIKEKMSGADARLSVSLGGNSMDGTMNLSEIKDRTISFPEKDKVRISFTEVRTKSQVKVGDLPEKTRDILKPISGKDVLLEKKDGKWVAKVENGEVLEENEDEIRKDLENLERSFNENEEAKLYGTEARKVGESWDVDPRLLPGMGEFEANRGKLSLLFKEVKDYEGERCAVIETTFRLTGVSTDPEQKGMEATFSGSGRIVRSLALMTDLKRVMETEFELAGKTDPANAQSPTMKVSGEMKMETRVMPAPEKE